MWFESVYSRWVSDLVPVICFVVKQPITTALRIIIIIIIIIIIKNLYAGGSTHYCGFHGGPENKINGITK